MASASGHAKHPYVCPWWLGYLLVSPLRKLFENPERTLAPHVHPGMKVLEVGSGMGFFTLPLARMVGDDGRVVCLDVQPRMLASLERRVRRAGLERRIEARLVEPGTLGLGREAGAFDLAVLIHVLHEMPDPASALAEIHAALKPSGRVLLIEPPAHVSKADFQRQLEAAASAGLVQGLRLPRKSHGVLLRRSA